MILTNSQARYFLQMAGFSGQALNNAVNICFCESSFDTHAHNEEGEDSRGLMQVNVNAHPHYAHLDLFDPGVNAVIAYRIYKEAGYSFRPWLNCARALGIIETPGGITPDIALIAGLALLSVIYVYYK